MTTAQRSAPHFPSGPASSGRWWHAPAIGLTLVAVLAVEHAWAQAPGQDPPVKPRLEKDLLGEKQVPGDAYYGIQTLRALENFKLSGITIDHYPGFVEAWAMVKLAAAQANTEVGAMKPDRLAAIEKATQAVLAGKYHDQFKVDWYQGGAGTSTNMNANEVLANIGLEMTGHKKGEYQFLEPHDDLNMSQSTNDSYPTAIKVALLLRNDKLIEELQQLVASFRMKADAYLEVVKMGRTEMQDAVPMTVGQEFHAFASSLDGEIQNLRLAEKALYSENMGATAIGTGINVPKGYPERVAVHLAKLTGKPIVPAEDMLAATWDQQGFVIYSSALKSLAIKLSKISGDLILLASGPRAGLSEINLPAIQPGSSIMPGKVNPVVPEVMNLVAFRVMGNDLVVTLAAHSGQLQLNAYEPVEGLAPHGIAEPSLQYVEAVPHQVHRWHHGERESARALYGNDHWPRHRAQSDPGLRQGHRARRRGGQEREGHHADHPREARAHGATDQGAAGSGQADWAGQVEVPSLEEVDANKSDDDAAVNRKTETPARTARAFLTLPGTLLRSATRPALHTTNRRPVRRRVRHEYAGEDTADRENRPRPVERPHRNLQRALRRQIDGLLAKKLLRAHGTRDLRRGEAHRGAIDRQHSAVDRCRVRTNRRRE